MKKILLLLLLTSRLLAQNPVAISAQSLNYQDNHYLVVLFKNESQWHSYWKNPGDAGTPINVHFLLDNSPLQLQELEWPIPTRLIEKGEMWAYGYQGTYGLFFQVTAQQLEQLQNKILSIEAQVLACNEICVPTTHELKGTYQQNDFHLYTRPPFEVSQESLIRWLGNLPTPIDFPAELDLSLSRSLDQQNLVIFFNILAGPVTRRLEWINILTPFPHPYLGFKHELLYQDSNQNLYGKMTVDWDGIYLEPPLQLPSDGQFNPPLMLKFLYANPQTGKVNIIQKQFHSFALSGIERLEGLFNVMTPVVYENGPHPPTNEDELVDEEKQSSNSLFYYLLLALLGGLILNIMPCVLPVISIKLFGLINQRGMSRALIFKHNLFYTLGVLCAFALLALAIIIFKIAGDNVGWGMQLQSPLFVQIMIVLLFVFALNLFGLFEFITPGGKNLGNTQASGLAGDFVNGIIATILATPCSAPFLGTALTFALTANHMTILLIFLAIGLGLSLPFLLIGIFPPLISFLPRPGNWMNHLKRFLGLGLLLTAIWLTDIYISLGKSASDVLQLNLLLLFIFFAIYFYQKISRRKFLLILVLILPALLLLKISSPPAQSNLQQKWESWSVEKLQEAKETEQTVFMDFTANWCLTCKVNEKLVLQTAQFDQLIAKYNLRLLLGDLTNRDPQIENWLREQGVVGVPAYFIQKEDGTLIKLGETISIGEIERFLQEQNLTSE